MKLFVMFEMEVFRSSLLLLLLTHSAEGYSDFVASPIDVISRIGVDVIFRWSFVIDSGDEPYFHQIVFGGWFHGNPYPTFLTVEIKGDGIPHKNPQLSSSAPSYVGRVTWVGDLKNSLAVFQLKNVTKLDERKYGCYIRFNGGRGRRRRPVDLLVAVPAHKYGVVRKGRQESFVYTGKVARLSWVFDNTNSQHASTFRRFVIGVWDNETQLLTELLSVSNETNAAVISSRRAIRWTGDTSRLQASIEIPQVLPSDEMEYVCVAHFGKSPTLVYTASKLTVRDSRVEKTYTLIIVGTVISLVVLVIFVTVIVVIVRKRRKRASFKDNEEQAPITERI